MHCKNEHVKINLTMLIVILVVGIQFRMDFLIYDFLHVGLCNSLQRYECIKMKNSLC